MDSSKFAVKLKKLLTNYSKAHRQKMTIDIVELEIYKKTEE